MTVLCQPSGAIGSVDHGQVRGWARDAAAPGAKLRLLVLLDGDIAGFAVADGPSPELAARLGEHDGQGDSAHGFVCWVAGPKLHAAGLLTVLADTSAGLVLIAERVLRRPRAIPDGIRSVAVHFDITDLLEFLSHHRGVSGIQRVQCGYLVNALSSAEELFAVRVCAQLPGQPDYVEIGVEAIGRLLQELTIGHATPRDAWRSQVAFVRQGTGAAPDFQQGDILLTMGAHWVHEDYHRAIETARREHGVAYYQILYDLIPVMAPDSVGAGMIEAFNRATADMLGCVDHLLSISEHSERDLRLVCDRLGVACPPVSVIALGATLDYRGEAAQPWRAAERNPAPPLVDGDYVLCVGTLEPRKNHVYLYDIWKRMLDEGRADIPRLVCVGRMGWQMEDLQRRLKVSDNLDGHFVHLTDIGDAELLVLYRDCLFTAFPSFYEGWGLPVAESLLFGKFCVSSNTTSMPEVGGDLAVYVDPYDLGDGYRVMTGLLDDRAEIALREARVRRDYSPLSWRGATALLMDAVAVAHAGSMFGRPEPELPPLVCGQSYGFSTVSALGGLWAGLAAEIARGVAMRLLRGPDWHVPEAWGTWSSGTTARLGFAVVGAGAGDLVCYLRVRLPHDAPRLACRVRVNGLEQAVFPLDGEQDRDLRIALPTPRSALDAGYRIELQLARPLLPVGGSTDLRLLGIGLCELYVGAIKERSGLLDHFEKRSLVPRDITDL